MPIPNSISDLDTNPNNNSPQGSETVGPNANGYIQALSAFIKQISTGAGLVFTSDLSANNHKVTNLANGTVSSTSKDAVNGSQLQAVYKVGEVKMWHGAVANIGTVWGAGWQLADGTNGTADLRDRFIVGAGNSYALNATGGNASNTLSTSQMPVHNHGVNDPGHNHSVNDPGHSHTVNDPGHKHGSGNGFGFSSSGGSGGIGSGTNANGSFSETDQRPTNISIFGSGTSISLNGSFTGISTQNAGSGASIENRPPYYALCFIEYTGIGA